MPRHRVTEDTRILLPPTIQLDADDRRMLVDIGFIALSAGLDQKALAIFEGVQVARPNEEAGFIGEALVRMARGDAAKAVEILRRLPPSDAATLFLGIALQKLGALDDAREMLLAVVNTPGGSPHAETARVALAEMLQSRV